MNPYEILAQFTDIDAKYLELGDEAQIVRPCEAVEAMEAYHRTKVEEMKSKIDEKPADYQTGATWLLYELLNQ